MTGMGWPGDERVNIIPADVTPTGRQLADAAKTNAAELLAFAYGLTDLATRGISPRRIRELADYGTAGQPIIDNLLDSTYVPPEPVRRWRHRVWPWRELFKCRVEAHRVLADSAARIVATINKEVAA